MVAGMASGRDRDHTRRQFEVALDRFDTAAVGCENLAGMPVSGAQPLIAGSLRDFQFAFLYKNPRPRKRGFQGSRFAPADKATAMVEMQMRNDYRGHIAKFHSQRPQVIGKPSFAMIENLPLDRIEPVSDSRIDQNCLFSPRNQGTGQIKADSVLFVGRMLAFPELARHNAEHASPVVAPSPACEEGYLESTDLQRCRRFSDLLNLTSNDDTEWRPSVQDRQAEEMARTGGGKNAAHALPISQRDRKSTRLNSSHVS